MQVRNYFIQKKAIDFYKHIPVDLISLPIDITSALMSFARIRVLSYSEFATMHNILDTDIIRYAESEDGTTHYHSVLNCYIVLYNDKKNIGRQRFTIAHEAGHIFLDHFLQINAQTLALNNVHGEYEQILEREADWFASIILCPFPIIHALGISSPSQIRNCCGLSTMSAQIKYEQYNEWLSYHRKTAWENDILKLFSPYLSNHIARQPKLIEHTY